MNNARKLRNLHRLTQREVSIRIEYPRPLYQAFENDEYKLPDDVIQRIAKLYNVSVEYLLNIKDK